jgi:O-antigen/teichoic acid export membrane protein
MNKVKLFVDNFLIYGIGGIISKIIPLIMVPIVTRLMPDTTYYGLSDLSNTIVSFASAFAVIGMYDAMYRMFFENDDISYKKSICSTTLAFTMITSILVFVLLILTKSIIAQYFFGDKKYEYLVYLSAIATLVSATNSIIAAPTRMQNKRTIYLVINTVSPLISYGIAIPLLIKGYYIIALPLATALSGIAVEFSFAIMNREWFSLKKVDWKKLKPLLSIALPLFPSRFKIRSL